MLVSVFLFRLAYALLQASDGDAWLVIGLPNIMHDIFGRQYQSTDSFAQYTDNSSHNNMGLCVFILALVCETWPLYVTQFTKTFTFYTKQYTVDFLRYFSYKSILWVIKIDSKIAMDYAMGLKLKITSWFYKRNKNLFFSCGPL